MNEGTTAERKILECLSELAADDELFMSEKGKRRIIAGWAIVIETVDEDGESVTLDLSMHGQSQVRTLGLVQAMHLSQQQAFLETVEDDDG